MLATLKARRQTNITPVERVNGQGSSSTNPLLQLKDIDTAYGPIQVHFGVNLHVNAGEIVCLLGGNASGKSTTMKIILGLVQPRAAAVTRS